MTFYQKINIRIKSDYISSDGGVFANSSLGKALHRGSLNIPANSTIPNTDTQVPYVIVGDEAFPLKPYLM